MILKHTPQGARRRTSAFLRVPSTEQTTSLSIADHEIKHWIGVSGQRYDLVRVIEHRELPSRSIYLASSEGLSYVLKERYFAAEDYDYIVRMYKDLDQSRFIRHLHDTDPEKQWLAFKRYPEHLLHAIEQRPGRLPLRSKKVILRDALRGIAELHAKHIVHTDIKPDNVLIDLEKAESSGRDPDVKIFDLECATYVPPGMTINGRALGAMVWRSPEAHLRGRVNKPTEMFSFGATCYFVVEEKLLFWPEEIQMPEIPGLRMMPSSFNCLTSRTRQLK